MGKIIEGVWDCKYCGTKLISTKERECPVCSRQRDHNIKFYIADPKNYADEEGVKNAQKGPDWLCNFCDALNPDDADVCYNCGAPKENGSLDYFQKKAQQDMEYFSSSEQQKQRARHEERKREEQKKNIAKGLVGIFSIIAAVILLFNIFTPKERDVEIQSFLWERGVVVEEYKTVKENDWDLPSNANLLYTEEEIRSYSNILSHYETKERTYTDEVLVGYETVVVGHEDLGNGYFEEITETQPVYETVTKTETYEEPVYIQVPVYDTKYYYEIDKWVYAYTEKTSGSDKSPYYTSILETDICRIAEKTEEYTVVAYDSEKDKNIDFKLPYDKWMALNVGQEIHVVQHFGGEVEILPLATTLVA